MARQKDEKKRRAIRAAAIDDVLESGLAGTSMPKIAKRAGISQGTIYLYFLSKNEMLQEIFLEIKSGLHDRLMTSFSSDDTSAEKVRNIWFAMLGFMFEHPKEFAFHEYVSAARILDPSQQKAIDAMAEDTRRVLVAAIDDGTLVPAPISSLVAVLMSPAVHLAKQAVLTGTRPADAVVDATYDLIWTGISA